MPTKGFVRKNGGRTPARAGEDSGVSKGDDANSPIEDEGACCAPPRSFCGRHKQSNGVRDPCEKNCLGKSPSPLSKTTGCASKSRAGQTDVHQVLSRTLDNLRIRKTTRSESTAVINTILIEILKFFKDRTDCFNQVTILRTGSYYENVKVGQPDEFDVILAIRVPSVDLRPFGDGGAFYSVAVKNMRRHLLTDFLQRDGIVSASEMLSKFRVHVKNALKSTAMKDVQVERKKKGSPAVTLLVKKNGLQIRLDIVLGLEVHSAWPSFTKSGFLIEKWLGTKVKKDFRFKPFYLVPKYEGNGSDALDGIYAKVLEPFWNGMEDDIYGYTNSNTVKYTYREAP